MLLAHAATPVVTGPCVPNVSDTWQEAMFAIHPRQHERRDGARASLVYGLRWLSCMRSRPPPPVLNTTATFSELPSSMT